MRKWRHRKDKNFPQEPMAIKGQILDSDQDSLSPGLAAVLTRRFQQSGLQQGVPLGMDSSGGLGGVKHLLVPMRSKTGDPKRHCHHGESNGKGEKEARGAGGREAVPHVEELSLCSYRELDSALGCTFWRGPSCWASGDRDLNCGREKVHPPRLCSPCSLSLHGRAGQGCSQQSSAEKWASGEGGGELCLRGSAYTVVEAWQAQTPRGRPAGSRPWESCVRRCLLAKFPLL